MEKEKNIFSLIVKNSIFAFLKEKYPTYQFDDKDDENIGKITELLKQLEKYAHIPDKNNIIKENFNHIKLYMVDGSFKEETFLNELKHETENLSNNEKNYILNAVIFITNEDKNISDNEKEIIIQIARFLDIQHSYKEILANFNKSEFKEESSPIAIIIIGILLLLAVGGAIFWKIQNLNNTNIFKTNKYQFDEISFNRYIIYKNQFEVPSGKFKKYAVYYVSGSAKVSFNPKNIKYNLVTKTITLNQKYFDVELNVKSQDTIDKVNAKAISESEAQSLGTVVGLAGASGGAVAGSALTSFLPINLRAMATGATTLIGGATGYFVTKNALTGVKLTDDISITEDRESEKTGKALILAQLSTDKNLAQMYKEHFESFIKAKYKTIGLEVQSIEYTQSKNGDTK